MEKQSSSPQIMGFTSYAICRTRLRCTLHTTTSEYVSRELVNYYPQSYDARSDLEPRDLFPTTRGKLEANKYFNRGHLVNRGWWAQIFRIISLAACNQVAGKKWPTFYKIRCCWLLVRPSPWLHGRFFFIAGPQKSPGWTTCQHIRQ